MSSLHREKQCTHTCSWAVGVFLLCVLAGLFHPREDLLGDDWGGSTGASGAGRFLFLCGVAVRAGSWLLKEQPAAAHWHSLFGCCPGWHLVAYNCHAIDVSIFMCWWPDWRGLDGTDWILIVVLYAGGWETLVCRTVCIRVRFRVWISSEKSSIVIISGFLHCEGSN